MPDDYAVGYKKPPKKHQFHQGKSGNPNGRPKGTKNLKTDLSEELAEQIRIKEGNRTITISKQRAVIKSLVAKTLNGDTRAANTLLNMIFRLMDPADQAVAEERPLSADEQETLAALKERLFGQAAAKHNGSLDVEGEDEQHD